MYSQFRLDFHKEREEGTGFISAEPFIRLVYITGKNHICVKFIKLIATLGKGQRGKGGGGGEGG